MAITAHGDLLGRVAQRDQLQHLDLALGQVIGRARRLSYEARFRRWAFGWRASFPWQPDVSSRIVLIGALLLVTAALRLANLLRRATKAPQEGSVSEVRGSSPPIT